MIDKNDPKLTAYAMGELSADEAREFEQLMADSPELTTAVAEIRATILSLESAFADEPPLELALSEQQRLAIESAAQSGGKEIDEEVASVARAAKDTAATSARPWGRWLLAAAIGTVLIGGGVFLANPEFQLGRHAAMKDASPSKPASAKTPVDRMQAAAESEKTSLFGDSVSESDFEPLIELVESTVDFDADESASGEAAPFPANLSVTVKSSKEGLMETEQRLRETEERSRQLEIQLKTRMGAQQDVFKSDSSVERTRRLPSEPESEPISDLSVSEEVGRAVQLEDAIRDFGGFPGGGLLGGGGGMGGGERVAQSGLRAEASKQAYYGQEGLDAINGRDADGMEGQSRPAPMAASPQRSSGMPGGAVRNEELMRESLGDGVDFPDANEWLAKSRSRSRFDDSKRMGGRQNEDGDDGRDGFDRAEDVFSNSSKLVGPIQVDASQSVALSAKVFSGGEISMPDTPLAKRRSVANEARKADEGREKDEEEEKFGEDRLARLAKPKRAKKKAAKTWKRVKAIPNTTRLMVGDKEELDLTGMQVNVQVDGFRARVLIDYLYYNDRDRQLEGNFKLRLPEDSSLYYFAFGESANELTPERQLARREFVDNGTRFVSFTPAAVTKSRRDVWRNVKEARMVPREQAAYAFRETVRRRVDPALVEWSGAGVFNAKVFPLAPKKVHRIVIGYDVNLTRSGNQLTYQLDLPESTGDCRIEINAQDVDGIQYRIEPEVEPVEVDHNDELHQRFTFDQRPKNGIRLTATTEVPLLLKSKELADEFWATQITPELPVQENAGSGRAMFMLDTSLSSSPDKFNVWLKLLESTLANNRDSMKEFGVLIFSVDGRFWKPQYVANTADNVACLLYTSPSPRD